MLLRHLALRHFRNYGSLEAGFDAGLVVLHGANAQGKTNLLEAIYLLATTKSSRARVDSELISWTSRDPLSETAFARIVARVERGGADQTLEVLIREAGSEGQAGQARKRFKLNGVERRAGEVLGKVNAVYFAPTDVELVDGAPSIRRRYLDVMLCQVTPAYFRALQVYNRAILQRNALLRQVRENQQPATELDYWDATLIEQGAQIMGSRARAVHDLGAWSARRHRTLSGELEELVISYKPGLPEGSATDELVSGGALAAHLALTNALASLRSREIAAGVSLAGPHRDDLGFAVNGIDATAFGSRGQQRTVALALKLAELEYMRASTGEPPILLLDDATSELDTPRRGAILVATALAEQTFVTSADDAVLRDFTGVSQRWEVRGGSMERLRDE